jgi:small subunit ribosomal protein S20
MAEEEKKKRVKRPTAQKRQLQDEKKRLYNKVLKSRVRTATRSLEEAIKAKDDAAKQTSLSAIHSLLDKGQKTGIYKRNKVCRIKSKFALSAK